MLLLRESFHNGVADPDPLSLGLFQDKVTILHSTHKCKLLIVVFNIVSDCLWIQILGVAMSVSLDILHPEHLARVWTKATIKQVIA